MNRSLQIHAKQAATGTERRHGGAALIVVVSLLFSLAFLGFLFYTFAAQERASAEYFSHADTSRRPSCRPIRSGTGRWSS